jgi:hypothetical protein
MAICWRRHGLTKFVGFVVVCEDAPLHVDTHVAAAAIIVQADGSHHGRHRSADHDLPTQTHVTFTLQYLPNTAKQNSIQIIEHVG